MKERDLQAALCELAEVTANAREENYPIPSDLALENEKELIEKMYQIKPCRFSVYSTQDGEVAIDACWRPRSSLILLCGSDGGALCLVYDRGKSRRAVYSDISTLPDGFIREAMSELACDAT